MTSLLSKEVGTEEQAQGREMFFDFVETTSAWMGFMREIYSMVSPAFDFMAVDAEPSNPSAGKSEEPAKLPAAFLNELALSAQAIGQFLLNSGGLPVKYRDHVTGEVISTVLTYCAGYNLEKEVWGMVVGQPGMRPPDLRTAPVVTMQAHELREHYVAALNP